jgi:hypothetical protein
MNECEEFIGFLPFQQSDPYAEAVAACGAKVRWCALDGGRALIVERARVRMILRGPVWQGAVSPRDEARALRSLARWPGLTIATPESRIAGFGFIPLVTPVHHAIWPLDQGMRAGLAGKWRNRLVKAENSGSQIEAGDHTTFAVLLREEAAQRTTRGYRSLPQAFSAALPKDALRLWDWRSDGAPAAAMAFVVHGTSATYHLGWASDRAREEGIPTAMLFRAAEALRSEGVRWLDLGSVDTDRAPGLARFKLGTGARLRQLGATVLVLP